VTQDAFLTIFRKIDQFREDSRFFTWFYRIVVNLSIDKRRKRISDRFISERDQDGLLAELPDNKTVTVDKIADEEFVEKRVQASILRLSPNLRTVTVLRYIEGLSYAEISETLECSIGTVKSRLNRAHRQLERMLKVLIDRVRRRDEDQ
jgi:RNA polymerase sigma-70 factor (ECF subfamily)